MEEPVSGHEAPAITAVLCNWNTSTVRDRDRVYATIYEQLRNIARYHMSRESRAPLLEPAALVNEAYLRLVQLEQINWQGRSHFLAMASRVMRQVLVDHARHRDADKRGDEIPMGLSFDVEQEARPTSLEMIEAALRRLEELVPLQARVVEARFFGGLSIEETADVLKVSPATVKRAWFAARSWLLLYLDGKV